MYKNIQFCLLCLLILTLSSCAAIFGQKSQLVLFSSEPQGVDVYVDNLYVGKTPVEVNLLLDGSFRKYVINKDDESIASDKELLENEYNVSYRENDKELISFSVKPKVNYSKADSLNDRTFHLCNLDILGSVIAFGIPFIIDEHFKSCYFFQKKYLKKIKSSSYDSGLSLGNSSLGKFNNLSNMKR